MHVTTIRARVREAHGAGTSRPSPHFSRRCGHATCTDLLGSSRISLRQRSTAMQIKPAQSEIRQKPVMRDPSALGGAHARSTLNDIERAEAEGMGPPEATTPESDR